MTRPNRLGMYADIRAIFDETLRVGGGEMTFPEHGKAVWWRQRAYKFRKLFADTTFPTPSPYDRITMPRLKPGSCTVELKLIEAKAIFTPKPSTAAAPAEADDELLKAARALAKDVGIEDV